MGHSVHEEMHKALDYDENKQYEKAFLQYLKCMELITTDLKRIANPALNPQRKFNQQGAVHADLMIHCSNRINTLYSVVFDGKRKIPPPPPVSKRNSTLSSTSSSSSSSQLQGTAPPPKRTNTKTHYTNQQQQPNRQSSQSMTNSYGNGTPYYHVPNQPQYHFPKYMENTMPIRPQASLNNNTNWMSSSTNHVPANRMSRREMIEFDHIFHKMDRHKSGSLSLVDMLSAFSPITNDQFVQLILNAMNRGHDKSLLKSDFKYGMFTLKHGNVDERATWMLRFFDVRQLGYVEKRDFHNVMQHLYNVLKQMHVYVFTKTKTGNLYAEQLLALMGDNSSHDHTLSELNEFEKEKTEKIEALWQNICPANATRLTLKDMKHLLLHEPYHLIGLGIYTHKNYPRYTISHRIGESISWGQSSFYRIMTMIAGIRKLIVLDDKPWGSYIQPAPCDLTDERVISLDFGSNIRESLFCYAPKVFESLRSMFHVQESEFWYAFSPEVFLGSLASGKLATLSEKLTDGKSGNFFYTSHCGLFMCKTINEAEWQQMLTSLNDYFTYCVNHPDTLLNRIYGLYRFQNTYFIILENSFKTSCPFEAIYDLKGSTLGRTNPDGPVYKDLDFKQANRRLYIGNAQQRKTRLLAQLRTDAAFLCTQGIIDYSFIVGIHHFDSPESAAKYRNSTAYRERSFFQSDNAGFLSADGCDLYYVAIIDTLIPYNFRKKAERLLKTVVHGDEYSISVSDPQFYSNRFSTFLESIID